MGDKEACEECKLKCSFIHGDRKGTSPSVTTFHNILSGVQDSEQLCLPQTVSQTNLGLVAGQIHFLEDSNNQVWKVILGTKDGQVAFGKGWDKFFADHGLREGYTLAFHYMVSHFVVQIIDETGIEKLEFPIANGKKRKRSEYDDNSNAVVECQNVSNTTTEKQGSTIFGTLDSVARTHSQVMSKDKPSGLENGNGICQHVSSSDCDVEQFCMVSRDAEYKYEEDRITLMDFSNFEMQFRVDLDGSSDKRTAPSSSPTESNAIASISNKNPVTAKVVSGEPPVEVAAFELSNIKNVPSKKENMEVADSGHQGETLKFEEAAGSKLRSKNYLKVNNEADEIFDGEKANEVRKAVKTEPVVLVIDDCEDSSSLSLTAEAERNELLDVTEHTQENVRDASPYCFGQLARIERLKFECPNKPKDRKDLLRGSQFFNLLGIKNTKGCPSALIGCFCRMYNENNKKFIIRDGVSISFCANEVANALQIKNSGKLLEQIKLKGKEPGQLNINSFPSFVEGLKLKWGGEVKQKEKRSKDDNEKIRGRSKRDLSLRSLVSILNYMELRTKESQEQYKKLVCFYIIDQVLLPSSDDFCKISYFKYVNDLSVCESINWAQETLDAIYSAALKVKSKQGKTFDACSSVFVAMILSRIPKLIPSSAKISDTLVPANRYPCIRLSASKWNEHLSRLNPRDIQSCPFCD